MPAPRKYPLELRERPAISPDTRIRASSKLSGAEAGLRRSRDRPGCLRESEGRQRSGHVPPVVAQALGDVVSPCQAERADGQVSQGGHRPRRTAGCVSF